MGTDVPLRHQVLPALAVTTSVLYGYTIVRKRSATHNWAAFALATAMTVTMIPFTWVIMVPTNNMLFGLEAEAKGAVGVFSSLDEATGLVKKWSQLHLVRSMFPLAGAIIGLTATLNCN
jgi:ABC-type glycerol-3-phosphate transport system permease component